MLVVISVLLIVVSGTSASLKYYEEGKSAMLECSALKGEVEHWFLHGTGSAIGANSTNEDVFMDANGTLVFQNVSKEKHEGEHECVVRVEEKFKAYTVQMDVRPLPPSNLWEAQYKGMFLTGFISAFICLLLFAGFCLVSNCRWKDQLTKTESPKLVTPYENPALVKDNGDCSIRM